MNEMYHPPKKTQISFPNYKKNFEKQRKTKNNISKL